MYRTTIMLPEDLKSKVVRESAALGISLGEFVRGALASALDDNESSGSNDTLLVDGATYEGRAPKDAADNHDAYLYGIRPCIRRFTHRGLGGVGLPRLLSGSGPYAPPLANGYSTRLLAISLMAEGALRIFMNWPMLRSGKLRAIRNLPWSMVTSPPETRIS